MRTPHRPGRIDPVVITRMHGGLGNQLFQFAAGYALGRRFGVPHRLDLGTFEHERERAFGLGDLGIRFEAATPREVAGLAPQWGPWWKNKRILWGHALTPFARRRWVKEATLDFDRRLFDVRPPVYLDGWWQSEKYFEQVRGEIRGLFLPRTAPSDRARELGAAISGRPTVAVHVRRGDYVANDDASRFHGCCSAAYYREACQRMSEQVDGAVFHVFSDDPEWARVHMDLPGQAGYASSSGPLGAIEDFYLMTRCRHFVIANSTFSWWAAWLSEAPAKRVIAPRRWFLGQEVNPADRFPSSWELLNI